MDDSLSLLCILKHSAIALLIILMTSHGVAAGAILKYIILCVNDIQRVNFVWCVWNLVGLVSHMIDIQDCYPCKQQTTKIY